MDRDLSALRRAYRGDGLRRDALDPDPVRQVARWLQEAREAGQVEPNAAALATADAEGRPSVRMVLVKGLREGGVTFFTNYESRKARELAANPRAALCLWWDLLERQVRIEGPVARVSREESEAYFRSRPRGSRLGAWASRQSAPLQGREPLVERLRELERAYPEGAEIPVPPFWGGYRLDPQAVELWQGGPDRLHDRFVYRRAGAAAKQAGAGSAPAWIIERLAP